MKYELFLLNSPLAYSTFRGRMKTITYSGDGAIRDSLNDGSTYYMLGYYPENKEWSGKFRKLQVKVDRAGVKLRHRLGYYASDPAYVSHPGLPCLNAGRFRCRPGPRTRCRYAPYRHLRAQPFGL